MVTPEVYEGIARNIRKWNPRRFRKGLREEEKEIRVLVQELWRCCWAPSDLNWWIGGLFGLGSLFFVSGSVLSLCPSLARAWSLTATGVNAVYFLGSLFFTTAAYLQLYQAANALPSSADAPPSTSRRRAYFGWYPRDIGWLSCALQLAGTVLFNFNTFDAMNPPATWLEQDLVIWLPDLIGSILFLASGYLAFVESNQAYWAWRPASISWWVTSFNLLGCVGFMSAAVFAIVLPRPPQLETATLATAFTLAGAVCFFVGSCSMLPEANSGAER